MKYRKELACCLVLLALPAAAELPAEAPATQADIQFLSAGRKGPFVATGHHFDGERVGVWKSETVDTATDTLMNTAVVRTH